jgi:hypothetical protein
VSLKPFFTYYGGKWRAAPYYPHPDLETLIEPFAGSAGYALRYPHKQVVLVEKNPKVAATWRYLLRVTPEEILALPDLTDGVDIDDEVACEEARYLVGWWLNKGTSAPCRTPSAWMRSGLRTNSYWGEPVRRRIASQLQFIRHWTLIEGDYTEAPNIEATWFIDPPYQVAGEYYPCSAKALDYEALGQWCQSRQGQVIVCENEGATWLPFRSFRGIKSACGVSEEVLWENHTSPCDVLALFK